LRITKRAVLLLLFLLGTAVLRFWALAEKPPHHDEAINGWFVTQIWQQGFFKYDPTNYHGPLLFYLFQWMEPLFGSSIEVMRGVTSFFSLLTVVLFGYFGILKRRPAFLFGALVLALSPAAEFFGRSAIHEGIFVFFMALTLFCFLFLENLVPLIVIGVLGMLLLKETWIIWAISAVVAATVTGAWREEDFLKLFNDQKRRARNWFIAGALILVLFYSGFLQEPQGLLDFFKAFLPWAKTGVAGAGHNKPFLHWVRLMLNSEIPTMLCLVLSGVGIFFKSRSVRFFSTLAVVHVLIYSLIPYKTPWCLISIQLPLVFAAALVLEDFFKSLRAPRAPLLLASALSVACLWHWQLLGSITWQSPIDMSHPYVYVQTQYDIKYLMQHLERAEVLVSLQKIQIATSEAWPFPWLFRRYPKLAYSKPDSMPDPKAAVIIFDHSQAERVRDQLKETHWERNLLVRQSREPAVLFIRRDILEKVGAF
jgi:uncharacterized protein (TIGR03663 family)